MLAPVRVLALVELRWSPCTCAFGLPFLLHVASIGGFEATAHFNHLLVLIQPCEGTCFHLKHSVPVFCKSKRYCALPTLVVDAYISHSGSKETPCPDQGVVSFVLAISKQFV